MIFFSTCAYNLLVILLNSTYTMPDISGQSISVLGENSNIHRNAAKVEGQKYMDILRSRQSSSSSISKLRLTLKNISKNDDEIAQAEKSKKLEKFTCELIKLTDKFKNLLNELIIDIDNGKIYIDIKDCFNRSNTLDIQGKGIDVANNELHNESETINKYFNSVIISNKKLTNIDEINNLIQEIQRGINVYKVAKNVDFFNSIFTGILSDINQKFKKEIFKKFKSDILSDKYNIKNLLKKKKRNCIFDEYVKCKTTYYANLGNIFKNLHEQFSNVFQNIKIELLIGHNDLSNAYIKKIKAAPVHKNLVNSDDPNMNVFQYKKLSHLNCADGSQKHTSLIKLTEDELEISQICDEQELSDLMNTEEIPAENSQEHINELVECVPQNKQIVLESCLMHKEIDSAVISQENDNKSAEHVPTIERMSFDLNLVHNEVDSTVNSQENDDLLTKPVPQTELTVFNSNLNDSSDYGNMNGARKPCPDTCKICYPITKETILKNNETSNYNRKVAIAFLIISILVLFAAIITFFRMKKMRVI